MLVANGFSTFYDAIKVDKRSGIIIVKKRVVTFWRFAKPDYLNATLDMFFKGLN